MTCAFGSFDLLGSTYWEIPYEFGPNIEWSHVMFLAKVWFYILSLGKKGKSEPKYLFRKLLNFYSGTYI